MSEPEKKTTISVEGVEYEVPEKFTLGELADIEEITGQAYDPDKPGARMTLAIVYIAMRRKNRRLTIDDVRDLDIEELDLGDDEEAKEEGPPAEAPPSLASVEIPEPSGTQS